MTHQAFLKRLNAKFSEHGSIRKYAEYLGISDSYLSRVANMKQPPSAKLLTDMGLAMQKTVTLTFQDAR